MKNLNKKFWSIAFIVIGCLFLSIMLFWNLSFGTLIFWAIMIFYIFLATHWLYRKSWRNILGLTQENITKKIIFKSFRIGLLLSIIVNSVLYTILYFLNIPVSQSFEDGNTVFGLFFGAIIIAPVAEEVMFRGFIQGLLQENCTFNKDKKQTKIIIVITSLLFAIAHIRYIIYTETLQWILSLLAAFIIGIYLGYLRYKYQSIIPSIFAHFGFNISIVVVPLIMLMIGSIFQPDSWGKVTKKMNQMEFKNDSIYNFDPNDWTELDKAQRKFLAYHNDPHPELKEYIVKGRTAFVSIYYDIDTCGFVSNIRLDSLQYETNMKYSIGTYTNYEVEKEAFCLVKSFPQHKPCIENGKKINVTKRVLVPIYY